MKNMLIITLLTVLSATGVYGQTVDSLYYYVRIADENNPGLRADFATYKASVEKIGQAGAWDDPTLKAGAYLRPMDAVGGRPIAQVEVMQMFPWPGTRRVARSEARHMAAMEYEQFRASRDEVALEVETAWWELVSLHEQASLVRKNHVLTETLKSLVASRLASGRGSLADALRIETTLAEIEVTEAEIVSRLTTVRARFNALLGRDADSPLVVPDSVRQVEAPGAEFDADQNPMVAMIRSEAEAADVREKMERKMGLPMIGLGIQWMINARTPNEMLAMGAMNGRDMVMPMVSVSLPVWRGKYRARVAESRLAREAVGARMIDAQNTLWADLIAAREELAVAQRRMELAEKQTRLASAAREIAMREFGAGAGSLADVLEIGRQLFDYSLRRAEAVADYNTTVAKIKKIVSQ